jgi:proteasome lid subunit RPN8/RPN11
MSWNIENTNVVKDDCPELKTECIILLSDKVRHQIKTLLKAYPEVEWIAALEGKQLNGNYLITELKLIDQKVTGTSTLCTKEGNKKLAKMQSIIGWIHSHNTMTAQMSTFDWDTSEMYPIGMVVNNDFEFDALIKKKLPCGREAIVQAEVSLDVDYKEDKDLLKEAKEMIKEDDETEVVAGKEWKKDEEKEEEDLGDFCSTCGQKIGMANRTYCDICGYPLHKKCYKRLNGRCIVCVKFPGQTKNRMPQQSFLRSGAASLEYPEQEWWGT